MNKDIARWREKVRNQPLAAVAMVMEVTAQQDAQHKGQQDLPGQADFQIFHRN
ncbi:Uncharacterised protein [Enterobacter cloacae]|nr:Uncharacterised protein [Enterobacter cloacae]